MDNLALFTCILFILTTALAVIIFHKACFHSRNFIVITSVWLAIQAFLSISGFYEKTDAVPSRFVFFAAPPLLFIFGLFISPAGRNFIKKLDPGMLILLHTVRIPVEITLYLLFLNGEVPRLMTFAGGNYDILSGLTAPLIYYYVFKRNGNSRNIILIWNVVCLGLLVYIAYHAILSAPSSFQRFAFDQPNTAILHFPYGWLPSFIVPLVFFSHLVIFKWCFQPRRNQ
jgi:hypothetical protein